MAPHCSAWALKNSRAVCLARGSLTTSRHLLSTGTRTSGRYACPHSASRGAAKNKAEVELWISFTLEWSGPTTCEDVHDDYWLMLRFAKETIPSENRLPGECDALGVAVVIDYTAARATHSCAIQGRLLAFDYTPLAAGSMFAPRVLRPPAPHPLAPMRPLPRVYIQRSHYHGLYCRITPVSSSKPLPTG
jgi:hypothetical protein